MREFLKKILMYGTINILKTVNFAVSFPFFYKTHGKTFYTVPEVFSPYFFVVSSTFFAEHMVIPKEATVLDLGTGSGILAIFAADKARKVIATDISSYAVRNARINSRLNKLSNKITVLRGNLFRPLKEKVDLILFNPPYFPLKPKTYLEAALYCGPNYRTLRNFLATAKQHLKPHGLIQLSLSSYMDLELMHNLFRKYRWRPIVVARKFLFFEILYLYLLVPVE
ncbi:MAG: methyltransferase [Candidatus Helarchaeota archaeon]|nr:methyltransferase [Candidatus Helarchaeota archaeon]